MAEGIDALDATINRYEAAAADLRAIIREAHSAIKDLRVVLKDVERVRGEVAGVVEQSITEIVTAEMDKLFPALTAAASELIEEWGAKIERDLKRMENHLFLGPNGDLRDRVRDFVIPSIVDQVPVRKAKPKR